VQDIRKYYAEWYAPNNAAVVIAGDIDHSEIFSLAQRIFGSIPRRALPPIAHTHPVASSGQTVEAQFPFPFEVLDMAYAVPGDSEPGEPAISTLAALIPNQLGPFYQALVVQNIALALDANADTQLRGGLMHVYIVLNPGHTAGEAATAFANTMTRELQDGFDAQLVSAARRATLAERAFNADSIDGYGDLVGYTYGIVGERDGDEDRRLADVGVLFATFAGQVAAQRDALRALLADLQRQGKRLAGYGATAKGNTMLNYCGIGPETLPFIADTTPYKQGLLTPGARIPVRPESAIEDDRTEVLLLLAWNYADSILGRMTAYTGRGGRFIHPIPMPRTIPE